MLRACIAALVLGLVWALWWVTGATVLGNLVDDALNAPPAGLIVNVAASDVQGFPHAFRVDLAEPFVADPAQGWGVQAAGLAISVPAYAPWSIRATPSAEAWIDTPTGGIAVQGDVVADLAFAPGPSLALAKAGVIAEHLTMTADQGWEIALAQASANVEQAGQNLTLRLAATDLTPPLAAPDLPAAIASATAVVTVALTAPIDRYAAESRPAIDSITLSDTALAWGDMQITATGQLTPDSSGLASGKITITITHWRPVVGVLQAVGAVTPQTAPTLTNALTKLEEQGGTPDQITLPLVAFAGRMILGPLPIGPAPRLRP